MGDLRSRGRDQGSRTPKDRCRKDVPGGAKGTSALVGMVYSLKCVNSQYFLRLSVMGGRHSKALLSSQTLRMRSSIALLIGRKASSSPQYIYIGESVCIWTAFIYTIYYH